VAHEGIRSATGYILRNADQTRARMRLLAKSREVFTRDSAGSNPRLWPGHPEAIQIAVHQSVEKIRDQSVTNRRMGLSTRRFRQKHWGFASFLSARFWKIPKQILRFYYGRQRPKKRKRKLAPRARFELATLRLTAESPTSSELAGVGPNCRR